jgi:hypothetical protein
MADYTNMSIKELQDIDVRTGKSSRKSKLKRWKETFDLVMGKKLGSSVPAEKAQAIAAKEELYERQGKLKRGPKLKVVKKQSAGKSLNQLSREGNADEIMRRIK